MKKHQFKVESRSLSTKPKDLRLKKEVPANIYGPNIESLPIKFDSNQFLALYAEIGESGVAYLNLENKEIPTMIEELQLDPVTDEVIHVSFKKIDLKEKVQADIPVELEGEFDVPEAVLVTVRDEIEVEALPTDLPEKFTVDVSVLEEVGQSITLADLSYDQNKITIVVGEEGMDAPVVLVQEVEEEEEEPEEIETEIIGEEEEAVEGEQPAAEGEEVGGKEEGETESAQEAE